jgi:hypothetical protein
MILIKLSVQLRPGVGDVRLKINGYQFVNGNHVSPHFVFVLRGRREKAK